MKSFYKQLEKPGLALMNVRRGFYFLTVSIGLHENMPDLGVRRLFSIQKRGISDIMNMTHSCHVMFGMISMECEKR